MRRERSRRSGRSLVGRARLNISLSDVKQRDSLDSFRFNVRVRSLNLYCILREENSDRQFNNMYPVVVECFLPTSFHLKPLALTDTHTVSLALAH